MLSFCQEIGFILDSEQAILSLPLEASLTNLNDCLHYFQDFRKILFLAFKNIFDFHREASHPKRTR
jgi:hypothetical protein